MFFPFESYHRNGVMSFGERTERGNRSLAGEHVFPRPYITIHLLQGGGFGTFRHGFPEAVAVSCVLDKGGGYA